MPQRHSKNNNDLAFFTYDEKRKLGYGTQKERLGKDSIKPFDACCLCLNSLMEPLCCQQGHLFCKECIFECLLAQKKDIKRPCMEMVLKEGVNLAGILALSRPDCDVSRVFSQQSVSEHKKLASYAAQQKQDKEDEDEKLMLKRQQELDAFDQQNNGAVPQYTDRNYVRDKNSFHGAESVKATSYEEEALRTMKAFWLPSATPEAPARVEAPSVDTICPEGKEKLKLKSLFPINFTEDPLQKKSEVLGITYICPSCKVTLTNTLTLMAISSCGHVFCKRCADKFVLVDKVCTVCNKNCKAKQLITLKKGGTGFSGHGDHLEATDFKHVGSGSGMGLIRPAVKT